MDLKELELGVDPQTHWYYQSKKVPMLRFIEQVYHQTKKPLTLIDLGSGSGFFMYEADKHIPHAIAKIYLVDIGYSEVEMDVTRGERIEKRHALPDKIENAVVVMMDVLEHVPDDEAMLNDIKKRCVGKNYFFITVPAFKQLWSGHDVYLGHYRRYTTASLEALLKRCSFRVSGCRYLYGFNFPLVWAV
ncbi:MAG TPA: methyltransferase domain-containing protein, partial [Chitinophagales bacterium]|nr:methyltransferase domain-containing protein [Chitinophagales bacterium]